MYDSWEDETGKLYHFPNAYRNKVQPGEWFVYHRGVRLKTGRRKHPEYFGFGRVDHVWRDSAIADDAPKVEWKWYCSIIDYSPFHVPVHWKVGERTIEDIPRNLFGNGVRSISQQTFDQILALAGHSGTLDLLKRASARELLDEGTAWMQVRNAAAKALSNVTEFQSPVLKRRYKVAGVETGKILIARLDAPGHAWVTQAAVERAVRRINAEGGRAARRTVDYTVAREAAIVFLHPRLDWSDDHDWIEVRGNASAAAPKVYKDFGQAPDDDPEKLARFARRVRAGQPQFRRNLLHLYEGRCAITGWAPPEVLEAAHILVHARSGRNHTDNGLLLRSDLHLLFDGGLLRIHPERLSVELDPTLEPTPYWDLHGTRLRPRADGSHPAYEYLRARWDALGKDE